MAADRSSDSTDTVVGLARTLRAAGVEASPDRVHALMAALSLLDPSLDHSDIIRLADRVEARAAEVGQKSGTIAAELARSQVYLMRCRWMDELDALERARKLIDPREDPRRWFANTADICNSLLYGPVPAAEAIERIRTADWGTEGPTAPRESWMAPLLAMLGRFDDARDKTRDARAYLEERGLRMRIGDMALVGGVVEDLAGDLAAADRAFGEGIGILQALGETGVLSTLAAMRASVLYRLGRRGEVEADILLARETGAPTDIATQAWWRFSAAQLAADDGHHADARRLIYEAVELVGPTDFLVMRGVTYEGLAHVEARAGNSDGWKAALERALGEHERKGNLVSAGRVRDQQAAGPPEPIAAA